MSKRWCIPIVWQMYGKVYVEADTLEEAIDEAVGPNFPLPDGYYLEESCEAAYGTDEIREDWNHGQDDD